MNKLTYKNYKNSDNILTIDLHNGYTVIAIIVWNRKKHNYSVELRIKENTVEKWDLIEKAENLEFNTNYKFINSAILKKTSKLLEKGFFDYYIKRYEYELQCFDTGNEVFEKERLYGVNAS